MRRALFRPILFMSLLILALPALAAPEAQTQPASGKLAVTYYFLPG